MLLFFKIVVLVQSVKLKMLLPYFFKALATYTAFLNSKLISLFITVHDYLPLFSIQQVLSYAKLLILYAKILTNRNRGLL